jgi:uncharacterized protein YjlB
MFLFSDDGLFPNHPCWPLLIYAQAVELTSADAARDMETRFERHGWTGAWRNGIYRFAHYHSNAHEVLGVFQGEARVRFGGPQGVELVLRAGDVAVLPAGTAHQNLGQSDDFGVVGAYPPGAECDLCGGTQAGHERAVRAIRAVPRPAKDPVTGAAGGLLAHWTIEK